MVNDKLNLLLECICLFMFNKKIKKESIVAYNENEKIECVHIMKMKK